MKTTPLFNLLNPAEISQVKSKTDIRNSNIGDLTYNELDEMFDFFLPSQYSDEWDITERPTRTIFILSSRYHKQKEDEKTK